MKRCKLAYLLAVAIACMGCRPATLSSMPGVAKAEEQEVGAPLTRLPDAFTGVWYPDDAKGASECERYRVSMSRVLSLAKSRHDGVDIMPVGSLVITPDLIHAVAEYGEGNFHAVDRIDAQGGDVWQVTTRLGIDSIPDEPSGEDLVVSRLSLHGCKLQWQPEGQLETSSPRYARCDTARDAGGKPS